MNPIERQLCAELTLASERLAGVIPALHPGTNGEVRQAVADAARNTATALEHAGDDELADTVIAVMNLLWHEADPPDEWWSTPLGTRCAMSLGNEQARSWTYATAAAWLGVARGTVAALGSRGTIAKHPDGGLVPADVVRYGRERSR